MCAIYICWMMAVSLFGQSAVEVDELSYSLACIAAAELKGSVILSQTVKIPTTKIASGPTFD